MESSKGKRVACNGSYGLNHYYLNPIPEYSKTITDRWGNEWLYIGKLDDEFARVAKPHPDGSVDKATLHHMRFDYFPCFQE